MTRIIRKRLRERQYLPRAIKGSPARAQEPLPSTDLARELLFICASESPSPSGEKLQKPESERAFLHLSDL
jgi:hypothetical protein